MRHAPLGVVVFTAVIPVMEVVLAAHRAGYPSVLWSAGVTVCYLPGYLRLVHHAAEGTRMRRGGLVVGVVSVAAIGSVLAGYPRGWAIVALGVSALLALRAPWAALVVTAAIAATVALSFRHGGGVGSAVWAGFSLVWEIAAVYSVVWLVGVARRLGIARAALAGHAVALERAKTERQLQQTLGAALGSIQTQAERAAAQLRDAPATADGPIEALVRDSRAALSEARRTISELSRASVRAELDTAMSLLAAAGMDTRVADSAAALDADDEAARTALRSAVAALLADPPPRGSLITVVRRDGQLELAAVPGAGESP
jgi:hypothetical protein